MSDAVLPRRASRDNALNTLKILAAIQIITLHSRVHLNLNIPAPILEIFDIFMGIPIFFMLSGFLIWKSIARSKSFGEYAFKRFIRIYPELWVGVAVELVAVLIFFKEKINWLLLGLFALTQGTILQFWTPDFLRSYGCGTPNGTLWTIGITIQFYIVAWLLSKLLAGKGIRRWSISLSVCFLIKIFNPLIRTIMPDLISKLYSQTIIPYLWMFVFGAFLSEYSEKILPFLRKWWWVLLIASMITKLTAFDIDTGSYGMITYILRIPGFIGLCYNLPRLNINFDFSYGLFIYHMIVVNIMIELNLVGEWYHLIIAIVGSIFLAILSTLFGNYIVKITKSKKAMEQQYGN